MYCLSINTSHHLTNYPFCPLHTSFLSFLLSFTHTNTHTHTKYTHKASKMSKRRVSFGSDINIENPPAPPTIITNKTSNGKRVIIGVWSIRLPSKTSPSGGFSPERILKNIGAKVAKALNIVSMKRSSRKVSSSTTLPRSRSYVDPLDSHRAQAVEDCIQFLNNSSSSSSSCLKKSKSVS